MGFEKVKIWKTESKYVYRINYVKHHFYIEGKLSERCEHRDKKSGIYQWLNLCPMGSPEYSVPSREMEYNGIKCLPIFANISKAENFSEITVTIKN